ncbi:hypothetical protein [Rhodococcus jostii]|uniref:hypothetical protein n=1 Tax=Rhodococcus jostii TaxID=132919 RepID=UPI003654DC78
MTSLEAISSVGECRQYEDGAGGECQTPQAVATTTTVFSRLSGMGPVRLPFASTLMVMVWPAFAGVSVDVGE